MIEMLEKFKVVPVVTHLPLEKAQMLGEVLVRGGLPIVEMTLRQETALGAIKILTGVKDLIVGAGTVGE